MPVLYYGALKKSDDYNTDLVIINHKYSHDKKSVFNRSDRIKISGEPQTER